MKGDEVISCDDGSYEGLMKKRVVDVSGGCVITIEPVYEDISWIELSFSEIDLGTEGSISIYDAKSSSTRLWRCNGCSTNLPPPIRSTTSMIVIYITAANSGTNRVGFSYFAAQVSDLYRGSPHTIVYEMPVGVILAPAYGSTDENPSGELPFGMQMSWQIKPKNLASSEKIILMII